MQKKIDLANFPTKIEKMEKISKETGVNIYLKRDDQTGSEISGNKIRKLEFSIYEALENGCDTLITCGGIQSNHARATAAAGIKLGMRVILVLRSDIEPEMEGNYFLNKVIGADIRIISSEDYRDNRNEIMEKIKSESDASGQKYLDKSIVYKAKDMDIIDGYVGIGYAQSTDEELEFIHQIARKEGVIFDPVYTGKAMYGMMNEIQKGTFKIGENILFIHTGGLFGIFSKKNQFKF